MKKNIGLIIGIIVIIILAFAVWQNKSQAPSTNTATTPVTQEQATPSTPSPETKKAGFSAMDVAAHGSVSSCYVIVGGKVYDLTAWIDQHPGGAQAIMNLCGKDGTTQFSNQHGSNAQAQAALASYLIGDLIN
jgi:cytochrome b involved in lipid metabolism